MIAKTVSEIAKKAILSAAVISLIIAAMGYSYRLPGLFMGISIGLINLAILGKDASLLVSGGARARNKLVRNFFIRYAAIAAILIAYCGLAQGSIGACIIGLAVVQGATFWTGAAG